MLETNVGMYEFWSWAAPFQSASQSISLRDAGSKTALPLPKDTVAKTYNRAGVYNGGWVATYCIDMMIQQICPVMQSVHGSLCLYQPCRTSSFIPSQRKSVEPSEKNASAEKSMDHGYAPMAAGRSVCAALFNVCRLRGKVFFAHLKPCGIGNPRHPYQVATASRFRD